jgi:transformation/transcription domain-associated protein
MYIICSDAGQPLREELAKSPQKILSSALPQFFTQGQGSSPLISQLPSASSSMNEDTPMIPVSDNLVPIVSSSSAIASPVAPDVYFHGLELISTLVKLMPDWLHNNRLVFDMLLLAWNSPARSARLQNEQELSLLQVRFYYVLPRSARTLTMLIVCILILSFTRIWSL